MIEPLPVTPHGLPVELVRTLQLLQDRIARGSTQAHLAQRQLLTHIERKLIESEPETWADAANLRAAVAFGLAGGGPGVLRHILATGQVTEAETPLAQGALAYLEGREKDARAKLGGIDARTMPASLSGQLALTQSALLVRDAPVRSLELLDLARLLAPGTLVEEGALRRQIFVVAQGGSAARFEALSIQYLRRFRRSVYAGNFRQRFAAALTRLNFDSDRTRVASLERMLEEIEPESRRDLYLLVARAALEQGRRETALFAAERAAGLAGSDIHAAAQARLYRGAALIVAEGRFEEGREALRGLDRAALAAGDLELLDAALSAANQIAARCRVSSNRRPPKPHPAAPCRNRRPSAGPGTPWPAPNAPSPPEPREPNSDPTSRQTVDCSHVMTSLDPLSLLRPKPDPGRSPAGDEAGERASPDFGAMLDAFETRSAPEEPDVSGEAKELEPPPPPADTGDVSGSDNIGADLRELMALTAPVPATPPVPPDASLAAVVQRAVARGNANAIAEAPRPELRITLVGVETHFAPVRPAAVAEVAQAMPSTAATGVAARPQTEAFDIQAGLIGSAPMPDALDRPITAAKFTTGTGTGDASNGALSAQADRGLVPDRTVHEHAAVVPNVADRGARSAGLGDPTEARLASASKGSASERPPQISPQPAVLADRVAIETGAGHGRPLRAAGYSPPARGEGDARDFTGDAASTDDWSIADRPRWEGSQLRKPRRPHPQALRAAFPSAEAPSGFPPQAAPKSRRRAILRMGLATWSTCRRIGLTPFSTRDHPHRMPSPRLSARRQLKLRKKDAGSRPSLRIDLSGRRRRQRRSRLRPGRRRRWQRRPLHRCRPRPCARSSMR